MKRSTSSNEKFPLWNRRTQVCRPCRTYQRASGPLWNEPHQKGGMCLPHALMGHRWRDAMNNHNNTPSPQNIPRCPKQLNMQLSHHWTCHNQSIFILGSGLIVSVASRQVIRTDQNCHRIFFHVYHVCVVVSLRRCHSIDTHCSYHLTLYRIPAVKCYWNHQFYLSRKGFFSGLHDYYGLRWWLQCLCLGLAAAYQKWAVSNQSLHAQICFSIHNMPWYLGEKLLHLW